MEERKIRTHRPVPPVRTGVLAFALQNLRIRRLEVLSPRRLHVDPAFSLLLRPEAIRHICRLAVAGVHDAATDIGIRRWTVNTAC